MPNDENKIILEFPATNVEIELGETITFDNVSGFLDAERVTVDGESLTEKMSAMDSEIDDKADADNTYTKAQVDDIVYNILPDDTASGSVANFETSLELPIKSLEVDVNAVQESGTPTPSTPIPISGWSEISLVNCGKNLFNDTKWFTDNGYTLQSDGSWYKATNALNVTIWENTSKYEGQITIHWAYKYDSSELSPGLRYRILYTDGTGETVWTTQTATFTELTKTSASGKIVDKVVTNYGTQTNGTTIKDFCIEINSSTYEPYNGNTEVINLGGTYYGGHFTQDKDGHRQFEVTHGIDDLGDLNWSYSQNVSDHWFQVYHNIHKKPPTTALCTCYGVVYSLVDANFDDKKIAVVTNYLAVRDSSFGSDTNAFKTAMTGQKLVYELTTPIIIDLPDGEPINTIAGVNNIYADTGDTSVVFKSSVNDYVEKKIANVQALALNT